MEFIKIFFWFVAFYIIDKCNSVCHPIQTSGGNNTLVHIINSKPNVVWIKPEHSFVHIKFVLVKETVFGLQYDKEHDEYLIIYNPTFKPNQWNYINFNILKKARLFEPDLYSLEATVNGVTKFQKITRLWWALIVIKSTKIYVSGGSEILLNCLPLIAITTATISTTATPTRSTSISTTPTIASFTTLTPTVATFTANTSTIATFTTTIANTSTGTLLSVIKNRTSTSKNMIPTNFSAAPTNVLNINLTTNIIEEDNYKLRNDEPRLELRQAKSTHHETSEKKENSYLLYGFNITLVLLCLSLVFTLLFIIKYYREKLKNLGGSDLSNIESTDRKNINNHYEDISMYGNKGKKETFSEELKVKPDDIKNIQWNIGKGLINPKKVIEKEDHCYDRPKSVKSETEETLYEELPEDLKP